MCKYEYQVWTDGDPRHMTFEADSWDFIGSNYELIEFRANEDHGDYALLVVPISHLVAMSCTVRLNKD